MGLRPPGHWLTKTVPVHFSFIFLIMERLMRAQPLGALGGVPRRIVVFLFWFACLTFASAALVCMRKNEKRPTGLVLGFLFGFQLGLVLAFLGALMFTFPARNVIFFELGFVVAFLEILELAFFKPGNELNLVLNLGEGLERGVLDGFEAHDGNFEPHEGCNLLEEFLRFQRFQRLGRFQRFQRFQRFFLFLQPQGRRGNLPVNELWARGPPRRNHGMSP